MNSKNYCCVKESLWSGCIYSGDWKKTSKARDVIEPATGDVLCTVGLADAQVVAAAAEAAATVQPDWASADYEERAAILRCAAALLEANSEAVVNWIVRETGSIVPKADFEVQLTVKALREAAAMPSQSQGVVLPSPAGRLSYARRVAHGVVGVISPFNFPLYLSMRAVAPALAVGNTVVLKPDPRTPISGGFIMADIFQQAGLPDNVLHVVPGDGDAGAQLCEDANVAMIQFTGSSQTGRLVGASASQHLKKVSLELGGKNALIVLDDADVEQAAANIAWGAYLHAGQICMASGKILVHRKIADAVVKRLVDKTTALVVGNPNTNASALLGPMISEAQLARTHAIVQKSIQQGAELKAGAEYRDLFYQPTVLMNVTHEMEAYQQEIFGPVACITVFDTDAEAISLANDTEYGLSAAVIGATGHAMAVGEKLRAGAIHINDQTVMDEVVNPFSGFGSSSNGSSIGGPANWESFTNWQWVTVADMPPAYPF